MKKYVVEFIGTFFLVFTIGNVSIASDLGHFGPLAIATVLTAVIYAGGHISRAHYNPAITVGFLIRGRCEFRDVVPYIVAQVAAAIAAGSLVLFVKGTSAAEAVTITGKIPQVILVEMLFTFALAFVIFNVGTAKATAGNSFYGIAIGAVVLGGILAVSDISGAVFNPAVAVGIAVMGMLSWSNLWVFLLANVIGASFAAIVFRFVSAPDDNVRLG